MIKNCWRTLLLGLGGVLNRPWDPDHQGAQVRSKSLALKKALAAYVLGRGFCVSSLCFLSGRKASSTFACAAAKIHRALVPCMPSRGALCGASAPTRSKILAQGSRLKPQATFRKRASPSFPEGCRSRRHGLASWPHTAQPCSRDPAETRPLRHEWERAGARGLPQDKLRSRPSRGKRPRGKGSSSSRRRPRTCTTASDSALPS